MVGDNPRPVCLTLIQIACAGALHTVRPRTVGVGTHCNRDAFVVRQCEQLPHYLTISHW